MVSSLTEMCCFSRLENKYKLRVHQSNYMFIKEILQHLGSVNPGKYSRIISATDQLVTIAYQMFSWRMTVRTFWTFGQLPRGARKYEPGRAHNQYTALSTSRINGWNPAKNLLQQLRAHMIILFLFQIKHKTLEYLKLKRTENNLLQVYIYIIINP